MHAPAVLFRRLRRRAADSIAPTKQFNLLRWFSVVSFLLIGAIAFGLGSVSTRFLVKESLERDALMTAQVVQTIARSEIRHHGLSGMQISDVLQRAQRDTPSEDLSQNRPQITSGFLDYLSRIPDSLLINIFSPFRTVAWSTNPLLVGKHISNDELEEAFSAKDRVSTKYNKVDKDRNEQKFLRAPNMFFVESYIPIADDQGNILAVVEIYREPLDLLESLNRGHWIIWLSTMGGLLAYFGIYWVARRASITLASQEDQVVANKTYGGLIEMSTAVAHSLRNPLACIRSSAELAREMQSQPAKKNLDDIVHQVDRMSLWVHELLLWLSPIRGEVELVEPMTVMQSTLNSFSLQLTQSKIQVQFNNAPLPRIISNPLLLSQIFNSVIANAIEAMPAGGQLSVQANLDQAHHWLHLSIVDTGDGTSRQQEMLAFKSFYTTRQGRLGIGLTMVKQIMQSFGGEASLSHHERGTSVHLTFRVMDRRASTAH
ncbi:HAMP domain-containing sensor histidine kinase [Pseudomonas sp. C2B4]|uniref:sensor histidine kinase n=1 Tax=Pseudomonas sp. C2B4 TaxID=2735270 RepID=UPI00158626B3|nr:HAMP domain-containing sensor histidine kinase [Pseudomonas sp. C2B4]NUU39030.1 HAMP domain-containing histidine kinase [Pseudomonas sp. C2B4]